MFDPINPLGTDGFEFVEYTAATEQGIADLKQLFKSLGFTEVAKHRSKEAWLYKQGDVNFIVNGQPNSQAEQFAAEHGPSVCAMAFRVKDAAEALKHAVANGAKPYQNQVGPMELNIPAVYGIGSSLLYFVDRYGQNSVYDVDFKFHDNWQTEHGKKPGWLRSDRSLDAQRPSWQYGTSGLVFMSGLVISVKSVILTSKASSQVGAPKR